LIAVSSTLNAWAKRPEIPSNSKHPATVTGAPEPLKNCRPAITAHTFDPPPPSLFEKPNWQIYEETNLVRDDATLSRQHSLAARRCRVRDLSLERHSSITNTNGRIKVSQTQDYYGTMTNRLSPGREIF